MRRWEEVEELMWSFFSFLEGGLLVMSQISARRFAHCCFTAIGEAVVGGQEQLPGQ